MSTATLKRRRLDFHSWPEILADIDHLHRSGYQRAGNWDLSQVLDHLGEGLRTAVRGCDHRGPWIVRKLIGPIILKRIFQQRRMKAGIKVPSWWLPGPTHDESDAVNRFRSDLRAFQELKSEPHPHPFFGSISKSQWNDLVLIHSSHHLGFLVPNG
jgi:hypothetical protein